MISTLVLSLDYLFSSLDFNKSILRISRPNRYFSTLAYVFGLLSHLTSCTICYWTNILLILAQFYAPHYMSLSLLGKLHRTNVFFSTKLYMFIEVMHQDWNVLYLFVGEMGIVFVKHYQATNRTL